MAYVCNTKAGPLVVQRQPACRSLKLYRLDATLCKQRQAICDTPFKPTTALYGHQLQLRPICVHASASSAASSVQSIGEAAPPQPSGWGWLWSAVGFLSTLCSCAAAAAGYMGHVDTKMALIACGVLTLVTFIGNRLLAETTKQVLYQGTSAALQQDTSALLAEMRAGMADIKAGLQAQAVGGAKEKTNIESRLSSLEGALLSTGRTMREASGMLSTLPERVQAQQRAQMDGLMAMVQGEMRRVADARANEESASMAAVSSRLAAIDGSLAGLEVSQGELARRLSISMNAALVDAESALQASVRTEIDRCMETVRRLPTMLASSLPSMIAAALPPPPDYSMPQQAMLPPAQQQGFQQMGDQGAQSDWLSQAAAEQLRNLLRTELQMAVQPVVDYMSQVQYSQQALQANAAPPSTSMTEQTNPAQGQDILPTALKLDNDQWEALGKRLTRLEAAVDSVPQTISGLLRTQLPAQLGPSAEEAARAAAASIISAVNTQLTTEGSRISGLLQEGMQAVQFDLENVQGSVQTMQSELQNVQELKSELGTIVSQFNFSDANAKDAVSAMAAQKKQIDEKLGNLSEELTSIQQLLTSLVESRQYIANVSGSYDGLGSMDLHETTTASSTTAELGALKQRLEQLQQQSTNMQSVITGIAEQIKERDNTLLLALKQSAAQRTETDSQLKTTAPQIPAQTQVESAETYTPPAKPPAFAFSEGLLSRDEGSETDSGLQTVANSPPARKFPEGMLSRDDDSAPNPSHDRNVSQTSRIEAGAPQLPTNMPASTVSQQENQAVTASNFTRPADAQTGAVSQTALPPQPTNLEQNQPKDQFGVTFQSSMQNRQPSEPSAQLQPPQSNTRMGNSSSNAMDASYSDYSPQQLPQQAPQAFANSSAQEPATYKTQIDDLAVPDLSQLGEQEVVALGLKLLRAGREESQKGQDWATADRLLRDSLTVFQHALNMAPQDTRALGNCGNVLLAQGELKQMYLQALRTGPLPRTEQELAVQSAAESTLRSEALALLTRAGEMFKAVLELEGWSSRALVNWGRAMCIRAELTSDKEMVQKLYRAALDKFEAVLEEEPGMVAPRYRAALAMADLARTYPMGSREAITLMMDACNYLSDLLNESSTQAEAQALAPSCAAALQQCQAELAQARQLRG